MVFPGGVARELLPVTEWTWGFTWRDWRLGASFEDGMWQFNVPGLFCCRERYYAHGDTVSEIPEGAEIVVHPDALLSDLQAVGATVRLVPR